MKSYFLLFLVQMAAFSSAFSQIDYLSTETAEERDARMQWWKDARFGMFIHWGVYAIPAGYYQGQPVAGIGEWIMEKAKIPIPEYEGYARQFDPVQFDARLWVKIAKEAGMKYIVITSKHHDGFCLWDSKVTDYDVMDFSPFRRDILKELSDACKAEGIRLCFYHSILDWRHPDAKSKRYPHQPTENPDWANYRENYLKPQLEELVRSYDPGVLWFDGEWIEEWTEEQGQDLYNFLRNLKPDLIINNRVGKGRNGMQGMSTYAHAAGDFGTPEQEILEEGSSLPWETCMTMNDTWGYKRDDNNWKSAETLIHQLIDATAKGGNYLLNVGPTAEGLIPPPSVERLAEMGAWLQVNGQAIYGVRSVSAYAEGDHIRYTQGAGGKVLYAHLLTRPGARIDLRQVEGAQTASVELLGMGRLKWKKAAHGGISVRLPSDLPGAHAWVLKIRMK